MNTEHHTSLELSLRLKDAGLRQDGWSGYWVQEKKNYPYVLVSLQNGTMHDVFYDVIAAPQRS